MKTERLKEILKPKAYKDLMKFMEGQTVPRYGIRELDGIFEEDFMRWFYGLVVVD